MDFKKVSDSLPQSFFMDQIKKVKDKEPLISILINPYQGSTISHCSLP